MQLKVLQQNETDSPPWYGGGLRFTCTQCGNCCTGPPGYVWISKEEIGRLAKHLRIGAAEVIEQYCRKVGGKYSLRETRNSSGQYDCIFLKEEKSADKNGVVHSKRACTVYEARPLQCRTWPFWEGNLQSPQRWKHAAERCHGMNFGSRIFSREQIESLRDAKDWPQRPPTSG
jgi:Fe-S-cluster containining protein